MSKTKKQTEKPELTSEEKCLSEIMTALDKYGCELKVVFRQTKAMDQEVLAYGINVKKK